MGKYEPGPHYTNFIQHFKKKKKNANIFVDCVHVLRPEPTMLDENTYKALLVVVVIIK